MSVDEKNLRTSLLSQPVPDEHIAEERTWETVRSAYLGREPVPARRRVPKRLLLLIALVGAGVGIALSPAGPAIGGWIRDTIDRDEVPKATEPALEPLVLPSSGRLLVASDEGVWAVESDGKQTGFGPYEGAAWSPRGLFVAAWTGGELVSLDPEASGFVHWSLSHEQIDDVRWSSSGFRLAYRSDDTLRVVLENGTEDHVLAEGVAQVAPAWRPGRQEVVAFADAAGRVAVVDADTGERAWRTASLPDVVALAWTSDAATLLVLSEHQLRVFNAPRELAQVVKLPAGTVGTALAARPGSDEVAYAVFAPESGVGTLYLHDGEGTRVLFAGIGRLDDATWSPDGSYLLVGWPGADQWVAVPGVASEPQQTWGDISARFASGGGDASFPRIQSWCCEAESG